MGNDNILIVVLAVIAYVVMTGQKAGAAVSSAVTSACPRGQRYSRGFFGDCDPNYVFGGWADQYCDCQSQIPSGTIAPQTPAPTRQSSYKCPYDPMLLAGDRRCNPTRAAEIRAIQQAGFSIEGVTGSYNPETGEFIAI